jgi:hypothetical protein
MESSQPDQDRSISTTVTLCAAATGSLTSVYALTASIPATIIAAAVVLGLTTTHLVVHR